MRKNLLLIIAIIIYSIRIIQTDKVCHSLEIKDDKDFAKLRDCTIVVGHIIFSNYRCGNPHGISSTIQEVTDYVLVYKVQNLESLEHVFPNLTIIRGHELLFEKYALVVFQNPNLRNLGLEYLLKIRNGAILIESNPILCFVNTINWMYLLDDHLQQHISIKNNKDLNECGLCPDGNSDPMFFTNYCWNKVVFQRKKSDAWLTNCPSNCGNDGCTIDGKKCCSPLCVTGCSIANCRICKNFRNSFGNCEKSCKLSNYTITDLCVSEKDCRNRGYTIYGKTCISKCPKGHQLIHINGQSQCKLFCNRNFTISSKADLEYVKGCTAIQGSLHIELKYETSSIIGDLELALGEIKEITGYLKITKSPQLVSLGFLKKLDTIKGDKLVDGGISFYVVDNAHLEEIWPENHKVAILKGRVFFHINPKLCYDKITALIHSMRSYDEVRVQDVSRNSNGERVTCGRDLQTLNPIVEETNATAARIKIEHRTSSEKDIILGYIHFFKEAPIQNVTMYDGLHGCGRDNWQMDLTLNRNVRHIINNLKPFTQYAFFVKTLTKSVYPTRQDWYSLIQYFRTSPTKPGPVQKIYASTRTAKKILIHWWPPKHPNGIIYKYMLSYKPIKSKLDDTQFKENPLNWANRECECQQLKEYRGPLPNDSDFYDKNQVIVENALPNLIFISRQTLEKHKEEMRLEDNTRRKRQKDFAENLYKNEENITKPMQKQNDKKQEQVKMEENSEELFKVHMAEMEEKAFLEQDTGVDDFLLVQPKSICSSINPSIRYQTQESCTPLERYEGIELSGELHSYELQNLRPGTLYNITLRACVTQLANECGPAVSVIITTITEMLENIIQDF